MPGFPGSKIKYTGWLALMVGFVSLHQAQAQQIEAEAWTTMSGLQTENTADVGGGLNVGYIDANDWAEYTNKPLAAGNWTVQARMATWLTNRTIQVLVDGALKTTLTCAASTGAYQNWTTVTSAVFNVATGGNHTVRLVFPTNSQNLNWIKFVSAADVTPPSTPTGLNSPTKTTTTINLAWTASTDNVGVTGYDVYRGGALLASLGNVTTYQATGLTANTAYSFQVLAKDAAGNPSALSTALAVSTLAPDIQAPSVPAGLASPSQTNTTINLTWTASTDNVGVTGYNVYRGGALLASLGNVTAYQATGLTANTAYSFQVLAKDAAGNVSGLSAALNVSTTNTDAIAPSVPAGLTSPAQTQTTIDLAWTASTDNVGVSGYDVYRGGVLIASVLNNVTTYQATGLTAGTTYSFQVRAKDVAGNVSALSTALSVSTVAPPATALKIEAEAWNTQLGLQTEATTDVGGGLNVGYIGANDWAEYLNQPLAAGTWTLEARMATWLTNRSIQLYVDDVLRLTLTYGPSTGGYQVWATATSGNFTLATGGNHKIKLVFPGDSMNLNWFRLVPVVVDGIAPSVPTGIASTAQTNTTINLTWAASTDNVAVTGYDVYRGGTLIASLGNVTAYQATGLNAATTYAFTIRARDAAGNVSALSPEFSATTTNLDVTAPSIPGGLASPAQTNTTIDITWTPATDNVGVTGYDVFQGGVFLASLGNVTAYQATGLTRNTAYSFQVRAKDAAGNITVLSPALAVSTTNVDLIAPSVPTGFASPAQTNTSINLTWTASTDNFAVTGYDVYQGGALFAAVGNVTAYQATGLTANTAYSFQVRAKDAAGNASALSTALAVSTTNVVANNLLVNGDFANGLANWRATGGTLLNVPGEYAVNVNVVGNAWDANLSYVLPMTVGTTYALTFKARSNVNRIMTVGWGLDVTPYTAQVQDVALTPAWTDYVISGVSTVPTLAASRVIFDMGAQLGEVHIDNVVLTGVTVPDGQAPTVPTALASPAKTDATIDLTWTASTDNVAVSGYEIYVNGSLKTTVGAVTTAQVTGLTASTAYAITLLAMDAAGNKSVQTAALNVTTAAAQTALTIEAEGWTTMLGLQTEATTDVGGGLNVGYIDAGDWAEYTNKTLSAGTYHFEARIATMAVDRSVQLWVDGALKTTLTYPTNTAGWQNWATAVSGDFIIATGGAHTIRLGFPVNNLNINWIKVLPSTPDTQSPTPPTGLVMGVRSGTSITFSWTAAVDNVGVAAHEIYLDGTYYFTSGNAAQAKVAGLEPNTTYSLAVIAKDAAGNKSLISGSLSASTNATYTNPNCAAGDAPAVTATKQQWWAGVAMTEPLDVVQEPVGNSDAWLVVEKAGRVLRLENTINGASNTFFTKTGLYLPAGGETGMAGLAFDPNYATNRYVYYTYALSNKQRLARVTASADGRTADLATEKVLLDFDYTSIMHRSGDLKFGPGPNGETYLYMSTGDGGHWDINQDNQRWKANDNNQPNGKILRLSPTQYRGNATLAWSSTMLVAKGLRNPWRMNFNGNDLYIGVVSGDPGIEELNKLNVLTQVGTHFGWPFGEGTDYCTGPNAATCTSLGFPGAAALTPPVMQYSRTENGTNGASIIGGMFYTGSQFLANQGKYVYADYTLQQLRLWDPATGQRSFLIAAAGAIADIGVDRSGELMLVQHNGATGIYKVVPGTGGAANWPPQNLADWGCFDNLNNGLPIPAEGVRYFDVAQRFWSDNAHKERFVAIPAGSKIDVSNTEDWKLPNGGVTIKNFYMDNKIFESRFFVRHNNGAYAGYTYRWDTPTSATLVPAEGGSKNLGSMVWEYPSRAQCMMCHTTPVNGNVALETRQVNVAGQVSKFTLLNMLNPPAPTLVPKFPDPLDVSVDINDRAQSYMHVNCATCHRGSGESVAGRATWDARYLTPLGSKSLCNKLPFEAVSGSPNERLIKAGDNSLSTVWLRAHQRTAMYMPPLGSKIPDADGVNMLKDWITGLTTASCPE